MLCRSSVASCSVMLAGVLLGAGSAGAHTTWYVDDDAPGDPGPGDPSISDPQEDGSAGHPFDAIQEGIDAASDGDTVLVLDGTYTGAGNKDLDFAGRLITVRSENGPEYCIIDCEHDGRGFYFHGGETADSVVQGFRIENGNVRPGGGLYCYESSPTVRGCVFLGNDDSAVYREYWADPTIADCTFVANSDSYWSCNPTIVGLYECNLTVSRCLIAANGSAGISAGWDHFGPSSAVITNCTVVGNLGGISGSDLTIANSLVAGALYGGEPRRGEFAAVSSTGHLTMVNCTVAANLFYGNGIGVRCGGDSCVAIISNSIVWGNSEPGEPEIIVGEYGEPGPFALTAAHNDVQGGIDAVLLFHEEALLNWGPGNLDSEPLFVSGVSGTWTADAVSDPDAFQVTFTDANAHWSDNELVGKLINADAESWIGLQLPIVANTATTVTVWAHASLLPDGYGDARDAYQIYDYRLTGSSPCIDAGCNCAVPPDFPDLDGDGDTGEYVPFDLDGEGRFFDDPATEDTGSGLPPIVDMGAYEFGGSDLPSTATWTATATSSFPTSPRC
jgi:hypothetical protein